jgi:hypothetical protein
MLVITEYKYKYFPSRVDAEKYIAQLSEQGFQSKLKMKRHDMWQVKTEARYY